MKKLKYFSLVVLAMMIFVACSDDDDRKDHNDDKDDGHKPSTVERKLKTMYATDNEDGMWWHFDNPAWDNDKLLSFESTEGRSTITYSDGNKAYINNREITLNSQGYAIIIEDVTNTSTLTYNEDGQLTAYNCDEDPGGVNENYKMTISYNADGDITSTEDPYEGTRQFSYTNTNITKPIENKGGAMIMEMLDLNVLYIDYYYFGIFGKGTKHLPVKIGTTTLDWTLDDKGYPESCVVNDPEDWETPILVYHFVWE